MIFSDFLELEVIASLSSTVVEIPKFSQIDDVMRLVISSACRKKTYQIPKIANKSTKGFIINALLSRFHRQNDRSGISNLKKNRYKTFLGTF